VTVEQMQITQEAVVSGTAGGTH